MQIKTVLIVDDDRNIRRIAEITLSQVGRFKVVTAASGQEALAKAKSEQPDVILLDVVMPDLDGPGTLTELKSSPETAKIPVIWLTATAQNEELEQCQNLGAAGVILKPFDPMSLSTQIMEILETAQNHPKNRKTDMAD